MPLTPETSAADAALIRSFAVEIAKSVIADPEVPFDGKLEAIAKRLDDSKAIVSLIRAYAPEVENETHPEAVAKRAAVAREAEAQRDAARKAQEARILRQVEKSERQRDVQKAQAELARCERVRDQIAKSEGPDYERVMSAGAAEAARRAFEQAEAALKALDDAK